MQGAQILRNEVYREVRCNYKGCSPTRAFGFAQGRESFDLAQDRELVERPVEWPFDFAQGHEPVEWQMDFLRSR